MNRLSLQLARHGFMAGCLLLGSCTATNAPSRTDSGINPPSQWLAYDGPRAAAPAVSWWRQLGDAQLDAIIGSALDKNFSIAQAKARLDQSRALLRKSDATMQPQLSAAANYNDASKGSGGRYQNQHQVGFALDASWELDWMGKLNSVRSAQGEEVQATTADLASAKNTIVAEITLAYLALRALQERIALQDEIMAADLEVAELNRVAYLAGTASFDPVERSRITLAQDRSAIAGLAAAAVQQQRRLELLAGVTPGELTIAPKKTLPACPLIPNMTSPALLLQFRPDVMAASARVMAQKYRVAAARADLYPTLKIGSSLTLAAANPAGLLGTAANSGLSLLSSISAPLWDGKRLSSEVKRQEEVLAEYEAGYAALQLTALHEVEQALTEQWRTASATREAKESLSAQNAISRQSHVRYEAGLSDRRVVLSGTREELSAADALVQSRGAELNAWVNLYKAAGVGVEREVYHDK